LFSIFILSQLACPDVLYNTKQLETTTTIQNYQSHKKKEKIKNQNFSWLNHFFGVVVDFTTNIKRKRRKRRT
jgi:predicted alpha-1,6-mannanase (GH76 family)